MTSPELYRILMPGDRLSQDSFRVPVEQPNSIIRWNCVLVVNDRDGTQLTVHRARLFPLALGEPKKACLKCGRVLGVVQDQVKCPYDERNRVNCWSPQMGFHQLSHVPNIRRSGAARGEEHGLLTRPRARGYVRTCGRSYARRRSGAFRRPTARMGGAVEPVL